MEGSDAGRGEPQVEGSDFNQKMVKRRKVADIRGSGMLASNKMNHAHTCTTPVAAASVKKSCK